MNATSLEHASYVITAFPSVSSPFPHLLRSKEVVMLRKSRSTSENKKRNSKRSSRRSKNKNQIVAQVTNTVLPEKTAKEPSKKSPAPSKASISVEEKVMKSADSGKKKNSKSPRNKKSIKAKNQVVAQVSNQSPSSSSVEKSTKKGILKKTRERTQGNKTTARTPTGKSEEMLTAESPTKMVVHGEDNSTPSHILSSCSMENAGSFMRDLVQTFAKGCRLKTQADLTREFNSLPDARKDDCREFLNPKNGGKNRYSNIYCLDKSRVELNFLTDRGQSPYIHANWVRHETLNQPYIITQGPLKKTVLDFWRMVWQYKCEFIIMLCKNIEENRQKCYEYYYSDEGVVMKVNPLEITTLMSEEGNGIVLTRLQIRFEDKTHHVTHLLFPNWPDHQAPNSSFSQLFQLLDKVRNSRKPVVVHCSAGIGRSGTLVALEMCLMDMANQVPVDVFNTVRKLRGYRCLAVQTLAQYMSLYMGILYFGKQNYCISANDMAQFASMVSEFHPDF